MNIYTFKLTQELKGFYRGEYTIEANSEKEAIKKFNSTSLTEIDNDTDWTHGDEYDGDKNTIEIQDIIKN